MKGRFAAIVLGLEALAVGTSASSEAREATATPGSAVIAIVGPDVELTHALEVALSPWGASVLEVGELAPGATMPFAVDRARAIARGTHADVVVWVSAENGACALWIYDAASDHIGSRGLESSPPFDAATAAAVALAVKTLLRGTVIAPPLERFGADAPPGGRWTVGAYVGADVRFGAPILAEPRFGLQVGVWPAAWKERWGLALGLETGTGTRVTTTDLAATVRDTSVRLAGTLRVPLGAVVAFEASLGAALHVIELDGVLRSDSSSVSTTRADGAVEPRLGVSLRALGGRLELASWVGMSALTRWQVFTVGGASAVDLGPIGAEGALAAALAFP